MSYLSSSDLILTRAGDWFVNSGIQESSGGVARYYRSDLGKNARVSTEITGYAVSALLYLAERTGHDQYYDAGVRAARFLTRTAWNRALDTFAFEHSDNCDQPKALAYFFDCGIIARGLLAAWRATGDEEFIEAADATGRAMISDFVSRDAIHPILALPDKRPLEYEPKWSASPGCYQLKSALAWDDLFEATGDAAFRDAYEAALENALASDTEFLPGEAAQEKVMDRLHAYCYYLEALLARAELPECAGALRAGVERTARYLHQIAPVFVRSDVYAQLLRVRLYAAEAGAAPLDETGAACEAARTAEFQLVSDDRRIDGGFGFGRKGGGQLPFVNPVSTSFSVQALAMWDDFRSGSFRSERHPLI